MYKIISEKDRKRVLRLWEEKHNISLICRQTGLTRGAIQKILQLDESKGLINFRLRFSPKQAVYLGMNIKELINSLPKNYTLLEIGKIESTRNTVYHLFKDNSILVGKFIFDYQDKLTSVELTSICNNYNTLSNIVHDKEMLDWSRSIYDSITKRFKLSKESKILITNTLDIIKTDEEYPKLELGKIIMLNINNKIELGIVCTGTNTIIVYMRK